MGDSFGEERNFRCDIQHGGQQSAKPLFGDHAPNFIKDSLNLGNNTDDQTIYKVAESGSPNDIRDFEQIVEAENTFSSEFDYVNTEPYAEGNICTSSSNVDKTSQVVSSYSIQESDIIYDVVNGFDRYTNYSSIIVNRSLICETKRDFSHPVNALGSQLNIPAWEHELAWENDVNLREYLSFGVKNGFYIIDQDCEVPIYNCPNYSSCLKGPAFLCIDAIIRDEISKGKYIVTDTKPHCVHSLGAVPKKEKDKWRPITDCKRPLGSSINCHMSTTFREFCYTSIDKVIDMIRPGMFLASVDIASAYRSILVHPSQWKFQGISWPINGIDTFLLDTHICFGLRCAPYLFTQVTNFVHRCMLRRGFVNMAVYLDDFLVSGNTYEECRVAQQTLIELLRSLGFFISWEKCKAPTQIITYLGVTFNTVNMSVTIPPTKMEKLHSELKFFEGKKRATKRQIQRLCGILSHCSKVIRGGRTFSHRVIELLKGWPENSSRIRLSDSFRDDILWWKNFADVFNGNNLMVKYNYGEGPSFFTDACIAGYGFWTSQDWQAGYYDSKCTPDIGFLNPDHSHWVNVHIEDISSSENISVLELIPIWLGLKRCSHKWRDLHVLCHTDNLSVKFMINKGCSSNKLCMVILRDIFWICATNNIYLTARHIPGQSNTLADLLSRIIFNNDLSFLNQFSLCCSVNNQGGGHEKIG